MMSSRIVFSARNRCFNLEKEVRKFLNLEKKMKNKNYAKDQYVSIFTFSPLFTESQTQGSELMAFG